MRATLRSLFALSFAEPAHAGAQATFEGTVTFQIERGATMVYSIGRSMMRIDVTGPHGAIATIIDPKTRLLTIIVADRRMYLQRPMPDTTGKRMRALADSVKLTDTGKGDVVAGVKCEIWHVTAPKAEYDVCAASDMGGFFPGIGGRRTPVPAWAQKMRGDFFPLRVTDAPGTVVLLATKVERKALDPALFQVPAGFAKLDMETGGEGMEGPGHPPPPDATPPAGTPPPR